MKTILFDLDGTLTDPKVGITTAAATALRAFGIEEDPDDLTAFIGPPLDESFRDFYGFTPEQCAAAITEFRRYFSTRGWAENVPYPGIDRLLGALKAAGMRLVVATSKPEDFALRIMHHFDLFRYFDLVCGAPMNDPVGWRKSNVIRDALRRAGVDSLEHVIMVGDRRHDVEGAREVGLPAVGVLYGYGSREELEASGAAWIAETVEDLQKLLLNIEL